MNRQINSNFIRAIFVALVLIIAGSIPVQPQNVNVPETQVSQYMTYQGRLLNAGSPANGNYDFEFRITSSTGTLLQTIEALGVPVTNGIFTARFLVNIPTFTTSGGENLSVGVRQLPTEPFIPLAPAQPISATPIAFKAHYAAFAQAASNAALLNGVASEQLVQIDDPRLSDARQPLPGSGSYIQNTTTLQTGDFSISGIGRAAEFNAQSRYSIDGFPVLSTPGTGNLFAGVSAGSSNTTGTDNAFAGRDAGFNNSTGSGNAFFGSGAGKYSTVDGNSFFGKHAGYLTTTGNSNSFFGKSAGFSNTTGKFNTFFGHEAGYSNIVGNSNVFVGTSSGRLNTADQNTFVGYETGVVNTTGTSNAFFGASTGHSNTDGSNNTFLGTATGGTNTTGYSNTFVGSSAGAFNLTGVENVFLGRSAGIQNSDGDLNIFIGTRAGWGTGTSLNKSGSFNIAIGPQTTISPAVNNSVVIGYQATVSQSNQIVLGTSSQETLVSGNLKVATFPTGGSSQLCANVNTNIVSLCSSSIRFKENVGNFNPGVDLIKRLRPVAFSWKEGGMRDVGFIAEEVAEVEPLLASRDSNGEVQGVKYDRISTALVNAVNEQQEQIESLKAQVTDQQNHLQKQREQIEALKQIVCVDKAAAALCKEKE